MCVNLSRCGCICKVVCQRAFEHVVDFLSWKFSVLFNFPPPTVHNSFQPYMGEF